MNWEQYPLTILSLLALFCVTSKPNAEMRWIGAVRRWGPVAGLIAQPFWLWATWQAEQWGMFFLSVVYTVGWARGIWNEWGEAFLWRALLGLGEAP